MESIAQLEKKLKEAKENKVKESLKRELKSALTQTGKGYATHSLNTYLNKGKPSFNFKMIYVHGAEIYQNTEIRYIVDILEFRKMGDDYVFQIQKHNYYSQIPFYSGEFRYDITLEQFEQVRNSFIPKLETAIDELRFDYKANNLVSQGDYSNLRSQYEHLKDLGYVFLKLDTEHHKVWEILRWQHHPFLFNEFLMFTKDSFKIIKNIADTMEKHSISWGGSIYTRDAPRVAALRVFYNKYKDECKE